MALGSSAPEILLSVIETVSMLGGVPGELGPSTIVGSAAFNLLVISAVSIVSVGGGQIKKIDDMGVFAVTCSAAMFAYIWLYLVLMVISKDYIEMWEAVLTLVFFLILVIAAFAADKYNQSKMKRLQTDSERQEEDDKLIISSAKAELRYLSDQKGIAYVVGAATKDLNKEDAELEKVRNMFKTALASDNLASHHY